MAKLSSHGVFRLRGEATTRLETFVDAAFAFAVTMLVISVSDVPQSYAEFIQALKSIPAFIASFFQLMMFWLGHRAWSRRFGLEDGFSLLISLVLVCGILVVVYPLRVLFASAFGYFSGGLLPYAFPLDWIQIGAIFAIYGFGFFLLCSLICLLYVHAWRRRAWLNLSAQETLATRIDIEFWLITACTGVTGMLVSLLATGAWVSFGGWVYASLSILLPLHGIVGERRMKALEDSAVG